MTEASSYKAAAEAMWNMDRPRPTHIWHPQYGWLDVPPEPVDFTKGKAVGIPLLLGLLSRLE